MRVIALSALVLRTRGIQHRALPCRPYISIARRQLRREREGHTLQPTALVHEAYLRLVDQRAGRLAESSALLWCRRAGHAAGPCRQRPSSQREQARATGVQCVSIDEAAETAATRRDIRARAGSCARAPGNCRSRPRADRGTPSVRRSHHRRSGTCAEGLGRRRRSASGARPRRG